jgi:FAD:protein FMN transferase
MHTFQAMNTTFETIGLTRLKQHEVESWIHYAETKLSRFLSESELSSFNRCQGAPFLCSKLFYEIMSTAQSFYEETDGWFCPYLGREISQLGYNRTYETLTKAEYEYEKRIYPRYAATQFLQSLPTFVEFNSFQQSLRLLSSVSVDLGGIAKGWSAQRIADWFKQEGILEGLINAGGDLVVWGNEDKEGWEIAIDSPLLSQQAPLATLQVNREAGIATSSTVKRRWTSEDRTISHHIVNPQTKRSSESDLIQVTVMADSLTAAEVYAKCLIILGSTAGPRWIKLKRPEIGFLGVKEDGSLIINNAFQQFCTEWRSTDESSVHFV